MSGTNDAHEDLLFTLRLSALYHDRRRSFLRTLSNVSQWATILFSTTAAASILKGADPWIPATIAFVVAALSTWAFVTSPVDGACRHDDLRRRYLSLEARLRTSKKSEELIAQTDADRLVVDQDEPPLLSVLMTLCQNDLWRREGYEPSQMVKVTAWQRFFAPFFDLAPERLHLAPLHEEDRQ